MSRQMTSGTDNGDLSRTNELDQDVTPNKFWLMCAALSSD